MATGDRDPRVGGVVLAAGRSARMGEAKALLDVGGRTFVAAAVAALADGGCAPVVVVAADEAVRQAAEQVGAHAALNADRTSEQIDSLRIGLATLPPGLSAAVVLPVDHPLVASATVAALIETHRSRAGAVARPVHDGRPGHPTLFPRGVWPALLDRSLARGARSLVEAPDTQTVDVSVDDPGILADIDTPDDYRRYAGGT